MEEQLRRPGASWWLARGLVAGKALLPLLGSQLLFGKLHKLVEKDLKPNQDTAPKSNQNRELSDE